mmetsp:Transcript_2746/g.12413  ORF Transcript_2746/g.12413 Transcript_2746/m.12413 type:complete len:257 (+) Transcript_2746:1070-1840(+)
MFASPSASAAPPSAASSGLEPPRGLRSRTGAFSSRGWGQSLAQCPDSPHRLHLSPLRSRTGAFSSRGLGQSLAQCPDSPHLLHLSSGPGSRRSRLGLSRRSCSSRNLPPRSRGPRSRSRSLRSLRPRPRPTADGHSLAQCPTPPHLLHLSSLDAGLPRDGGPRRSSRSRKPPPPPPFAESSRSSRMRMLRPSRLVSESISTARAASSMVDISTMPQPLERPPGPPSVRILVWTTSPAWRKWSLRSCHETRQERLWT